MVVVAHTQRVYIQKRHFFPRMLRRPATAEPQHRPDVHEIRHGVAQIVYIVVPIGKHGLVDNIVATGGGGVDGWLVELRCNAM